MIERNDVATAARVVSELCPDTQVQRVWAGHALRSIRIAQEVATNSWAITLFPNKVRLNVGQVAVLELWHGTVVFYCCAPVAVRPARGLRRFKWVGYRAVPSATERWGVDTVLVAQTPIAIISKHHELVRLAAKAKRQTPFRRAHSPGVVAFLHQAVDENIAIGERPLPEELAGAAYPEGATRRVTVNAYERSDAARAACIEHHGTACAVCGLAFGVLYGPLAEGYIHVHHLKAISQVGTPYQVDPLNDLRPVCPNCHAVIHLEGETRSIDDVRRLLRDAPRANKRLQPTAPDEIMSRRG